MKHPPEDHSIFQCDIIDETVAKVHQEDVEEMHMEQDASVETPPELTEEALPPQIAPDDREPPHEQKMELKPLPPHLKKVCSFLGHVGFYRRFVKDFSKVALPLSQLLQKDVEFELSTDCKEAFYKLKTALTHAPIVRGPD
nr:uncharacterized protein LOC112805565 [Arachis hypogaea]